MLLVYNFFPTLTFPFPLLPAYLMGYCRFTSPSPCSLISLFFLFCFFCFQGLNSKTTNKVCSCGKNNAKDSEKASCTKDDKGHSHCPCVISGIFVPAIVDAKGVKTQPCKLLALLQVKLDTPLMFPTNVATTK